MRSENEKRERLIDRINQEEIKQQVKETEERGEKVFKYLELYKGDKMYNEIALAIEFGYQLALEEKF